MKKKVIVSVAIIISICILLALFSSRCNTKDEKQQLTIGGSNPGGTAYIVGTTYAQVINKYNPNLNVTHEVTAGGKENIELTSTNETDFGCGMSAFLYEAYNGLGDYENDAREDLRGVIPWFKYPMQIVVRKDGDIKKITDLKDKKISINVQGSGGYKAATEVLSTLGLEENVDYIAYYLSFDEAADEMKLGNIDAIFINTGAPVPAIMSMGTYIDFDIINFSDEEIEKVIKKYPYYQKGILKSGTYDKVQHDVNTLTSYTILFANANVDEEVVYKIVKTIWEHREELALAHSSQEDLNERLVEESILNIAPIHPGALKYYKESGIIK